MAADETSPRPGDTEPELLRKILLVLGGNPSPGDTTEKLTAKILLALQGAINGGVTGSTVVGNLTFVGAAPRVNQSVTSAELSLLGGTGKTQGAAIDLHGASEAGGMSGWMELGTVGSGAVFTFSNFPTPGSVVGGKTIMNLSDGGLLTFGPGAPGVVLSNLTGAQRDALVAPLAGTQIFNTDTKKLNYYDGTAWQAVA